MLDFVLHALRANPEIAIFLAIASGTMIGRIRLGKFHLGTVAGSLLMGLVIGQIGIEEPHLLKAVFFALFIYAVGFKSGPGFFGSLNINTLKLVLFSIVLCVTGLLTILLMNKLFGFDAGFAAGLGAGALTDTAMMGTASSALNELPLSVRQLAELNSHMAVAYAITYLFGTVGLIVFVSSIAPMLLKINLKESARELERELSGNASTLQPDEIIPYTRIVVRAYRIAGSSEAQGLSIREVETSKPDMSIERVVRAGVALERDESLRLQIDDVVGLAAKRGAVSAISAFFGPEVDNTLALSYPSKAVEIVLTHAGFTLKSLTDLASSTDSSSHHGLFINRITRQGYELPLLANTALSMGDVIHVTGRPSTVDVLAPRIGRVKTSKYKSDIAVHTLGIVAGSLLGLLSAHLGKIPIELGVGGGVLLVALLLGWLHSRFPSFGDLPPAAQWAFSEFGLTGFAAVVGLLAGPQAIAAMQEHGLSLLLAGVAVTLVPPLVAFYFGRYILKLHPMILLGGLAGAQTEAASMNTIIEESQSQTPVIGFTVCYAISNVLFAVWGPIIVAFST